MRHSPVLDSFLEGAVHLPAAKSYFLNLLDDEVTQNGNCLAVLAIDEELAAARILVHGDKRASVRLSH